MLVLSLLMTASRLWIAHWSDPFDVVGLILTVMLGVAGGWGAWACRRKNGAESL